MNPKHVASNIRKCEAIASDSNCPRRKFGALIVNPDRNSIVGTGYNGGPRGDSGPLCGGVMCHRDGAPTDPSRYSFHKEWTPPRHYTGTDYYTVVVHGTDDRDTSTQIGRFGINSMVISMEQVMGRQSPADMEATRRANMSHTERTQELANKVIAEYQAKYPPIPSGQKEEVGCVHAEQNAIYNCAHDGVSTAGRWIFLLGGPCLMCAKAIHHSGIAHVVLVRGGYIAESAGMEYLKAHEIQISEVDGPLDPRTPTEEQDDVE